MKTQSREGNKLKQDDQIEKMKQFSEKVKDGPEYVCCVCNRLLFRHQVLHCKQADYNKNDKVASIAANCIREEYYTNVMGTVKCLVSG